MQGRLVCKWAFLLGSACSPPLEACGVEEARQRPKEFYGSNSSMEKRISISRSALRAVNLGPRRSQIGRGPSSESAGGYHRGSGSSAQCRRR